MINRNRLVETFMELVQVDSETKEEAAMAQCVKERFTQLGCEVKEDNAKELTGFGANNLVVTLPSNHSGDKIFFSAHMDTVKPGKGIRPILHEDGMITSSGDTILGADDKVGIAVMLEVIQILKEKNLPHGPIQFLLTVGEESGIVGSQALDASLLDVEYGFTLDSSGKVGEVVTAAPYKAKIKATVHGKASHAGIHPEDGISAIEVASKAITTMPLGRIDEETTANIGQFIGDVATNVVCDTVTLLGEARSQNGEKFERLIQQMEEALQNAASERGATVDIEVKRLYPGYKYRDEDQVVQKALTALRKIGLDPSTKVSGGGSDANVLNSYNIPVVNLAVGYELNHTVNERVHSDQIVKAAEMTLTLTQLALTE